MKKLSISKVAGLVTGFAVTALLVGVTTACKPKSKPVVPEDDPHKYLDASFKLSIGDSTGVLAVGETLQTQIVDVKGGIVADDLELAFSTSDPEVLSVSASGLVTAKQPGFADVIAIDEESGAVDSVQIQVKGVPAQGAKSYSGAGYQTQAEILGVLEKYAQDTYLSGLPLAGDGSFVMYHPRVQKGTENYVEGYGFGILQHGDLTADLEGETNAAYKRYLHSYTSEDPQNLNEWAANSSSVSDLASYVVSGYFGSKLNEDKTGEEYYPVLSNDEDFEALNASEDAEPKATRFKLHVKTGEQAKYSTLSKNAKFSKYNGREVALEDYLTPFKLMLTKKFNLYRGNEMVAETYARPIKGAAEYYNQTGEGMNEELFNSTVGVKVGEDEKGGYIEFEFAKALKVSDAKVNLSSSLWQPIPMEFINDLGGDPNLYASFSEDKSLSPVDTTLSLSAYTLEYYESGKLITFKRNPEWFEKTEDTGMYKIPGVHIAILEAAKQDTEAAWREFMANKLDSITIPGTHLNEYKNDPRTVEIPETTTWKLNINATTEELWEELFGKNGSVYQTTDEKDYWDVKPVMQNIHFLDGLYYSLNRIEFAGAQNMTASQNYLSRAYYFTYKDAKTGETVKVTYDDMDAHQKAIANRYPETFGFNLTAAKAYFKLAIQELLADGSYELGTIENPSKIEISAKWMSQTSLTRMGEPLTKYMMDAFNSVDPRIQLVINNSACSTSDEMYEALERGQFDIGMGAITGMQAWPLDFFQVLCSDNRSGFCLNWGPDTSVNDGKIFYDGNTWSFDCLWEAGTTSTVAVAGETGFAFNAALSAREFPNDGAEEPTYTGDVVYTALYEAIAAQGVSWKITGLYLEDYATNSGIGTGMFGINLATGALTGVYKDQNLGVDHLYELDEEAGSVQFTVPKELNDEAFRFTKIYAEVNEVTEDQVIAAGYEKYNYRFDVYFEIEIEFEGSKFTTSFLPFDIYAFNYFAA
ncbi:MAG: hypothetical protein IJ656_00290 [Bacilli bacterium]|nr:hypothetical protein [Bacilli bacterium]